MYRDYKIAVVVPAYKEELLIEETLSGIPDYVDVIYAVEDCSPDRTGEIIDNYAKKDPRVVPIHHEVNGGVGAAIVDCCDFNCALTTSEYSLFKFIKWGNYEEINQ